MSELFNLPGMELLRQAAQFGQPQAPSDATSTPQPKPGPGLGGGGGRSGSGTSRSAAQAKQKAADKDWDEATAGLGEHNPEPVADPVENKPKARLKKVGWVADKTQFQSNPEVFAEFEVPESEKFRTRVEFELLVREKGRFKPVAHSITNTNADASGRAVAKVCIPKASEVVPSGDPIKAVFAIKAKHCSADWSNGDGTEREVTETAEIQFKHTLVSGIHFAQNKSFIAPQYLKVFREFESTLKTWWKENDSAHFVIFGHVERDEEDPGKLSARRAQAAFAFLIGDYCMWGRIADAERWGVWEQQSMLQGMGFFNGKVDGVSGEKTSKAIRDFIVYVNEKEGKSLNPNLEFTQDNNLNELYRLYITGEKRKVEIHDRHIRSVAGNPYVGCRSFNRYVAGNELRAENRRATFLILTESFNYPVDFPCGTSTGPCDMECKKPGERTVKGFGCKFYDDLMKKETDGVKEAPSPQSQNEPVENSDDPQWLAIAEKEVGTQEILGNDNNPRIIEYHSATSLKATNDETAWCSAFMNWVMLQAGIPGTGEAKALSWQIWGEKIESPVRGCVGVIKYASGGGHVGLIVGQKSYGENRPGYILLGGNQGKSGKGKVCESWFPKSDFVAYRLPTGHSGSQKPLGTDTTRDFEKGDFASTR